MKKISHFSIFLAEFNHITTSIQYGQFFCRGYEECVEAPKMPKEPSSPSMPSSQPEISRIEPIMPTRLPFPSLLVPFSFPSTYRRRLLHTVVFKSLLPLTTMSSCRVIGVENYFRLFLVTAIYFPCFIASIVKKLSFFRILTVCACSDQTVLQQMRLPAQDGRIPLAFYLIYTSVSHVIRLSTRRKFLCGAPIPADV